MAASRAEKPHRPEIWMLATLLSNLAWVLVFALSAGPAAPPASHIQQSLSLVSLRWSQHDASTDSHGNNKNDAHVESTTPGEMAPAAEGDSGTRDSPGALTIPRILHQIYLGGSLSDVQQRWVDSCRYHLNEPAGWRYQLWNDTAAEDLIATVDPGFLEAFNSYGKPVQRADALRYYIMKHVGGLYLDVDTECWREGSDMLEGADLVLQGHHQGEAAANGMLASVPGHPFWDDVIQLVKERRYTVANETHVIAVLNGTGPLLLRDSILAYFNQTLGDDGYLRPVPPEFPRVKIHPIGSWYIPCCFVCKECILDIMLKRAVGHAPLGSLAGMHHYTIHWSDEEKDDTSEEDKFKLALCPKDTAQPQQQAANSVAPNCSELAPKAAAESATMGDKQQHAPAEAGKDPAGAAVQPAAAVAAGVTLPVRQPPGAAAADKPQRSAPKFNPANCHLDSEGSWSIGLFRGPSPLDLKPFAGPKRDANPILTCASVLDPPSNFVADPFLWMPSNSTSWFIFFETKTNTHMHGDIGVAESVDAGATWRYKGIALDEPWHLSYPFLFEWQGEVYMLPEAGGTGRLRLYQAASFPMRWEQHSVLLEGAFADSTLVEWGGKWWMFTSPAGTLHSALMVLHIYYADSPLGPWQPHASNPIKEDIRGGRSAGRVLHHDGTLLRFAQDSSQGYGHAVIAYRIEELTPTEYREVEVQQTLLYMAPGTAAWNGVRRHHVDAHQMSDGSWVVVMDGDNRKS